MARRPRLEDFARDHGLLMVTIADLIAWRKRHEVIVERVSSCRLPTKYGVFELHGFRELSNGQEHLALVIGQPGEDASPLVRVHSECLTGEVFGSLRCDCAPQLSQSMSLVAAAGCGAIVYLRGHEGRGIGLLHKLRAYALQDGGADTVQANLALGFPADQRDYAIGAQILRQIGVSRMRLMTNNPRKYEGLADFGLEIAERVPLVIAPDRENAVYLASKQRLFGHLLGMEG